MRNSILGKNPGRDSLVRFLVRFPARLPGAPLSNSIAASIDASSIVTIQLTSDLPDSGVKSAHIHLYTARFILVLEQIRGNPNSYE
jgi:hypothetical protein